MQGDSNLPSGLNQSNLTVLKDLLIYDPKITHWRFEVHYQWNSGITISRLNVQLNSSPQNGSCSISPLRGTLITQFTIDCVNWTDANGIADFSFYLIDSKTIMLGSSSISTHQLRLPNREGEVNIVVQIRDKLQCVTEFHLPPVIVQPDEMTVREWLTMVENGSETSLEQMFISMIDYLNRQASEPLSFRCNSVICEFIFR